MKVDSNVWAAIISSSFTGVIAIGVVLYQNRRTARQLRSDRIAIMKEKWMSEFRNTFVELLTSLDNYAYANIQRTERNLKQVKKLRENNVSREEWDELEDEDLANNVDIRTARLNRYRLELMFRRKRKENNELLEKIDEYIEMHLDVFAAHYNEEQQNDLKKRKQELIGLVEVKLNGTWNEVQNL